MMRPAAIAGLLALLLAAPAGAQVHSTNGCPFASISQLGCIKGDGSTVSISATGVLAAVAGAAGINQLTGDVTAGPGVGSQAATVGAIGGKAISLSAALTTTGAGAATLAFPAGAATFTFPGGADTLAGLGTIETWTATQTFNSGKLVATSPSFTTPTLGAASATTINKVTITQPATGSTLTIADGKTLTASNSITFAGTDATTMTFPSTSATIARTDAGNTFTGHQTIEGVTSTGATGSGNLVFANTPTLGGLVLNSGSGSVSGGIGYGASTFQSNGDTWNFNNAANTVTIFAITKGQFTLSGATSGSTILQPTAAASGTLTLPAATDTLVARATTDTLTNKTLTDPLITAHVVSALPTCNAGEAGAISYVTDQNTATAYLGAVTGGGAGKQRVLCNGSSWVQD